MPTPNNELLEVGHYNTVLSSKIVLLRLACQHQNLELAAAFAHKLAEADVPRTEKAIEIVSAEATNPRSQAKNDTPSFATLCRETMPPPLQRGCTACLGYYLDLT